MCKKKVRFARMITTAIHNIEHKETQKFWWSKEDIDAFKFQRLQAIQHVQNIGIDIANITDASDYMGLELHLTKGIEIECEQHRQQFIRSVIDEQQKCSSPEELSSFACRKSRRSVSRSHKVGRFHADRSFDEIKLELSLVPSRLHFNGSQSVCSCPRTEVSAARRISSIT
jgi:hypothetical protein